MAKTAYAFPAKRLKATANEPLFKAFNHLGEFSNMKNEILQAMSQKNCRHRKAAQSVHNFDAKIFVYGSFNYKLH